MKSFAYCWKSYLSYSLLSLPVTVPVDDFPAVIAQSSVPSVASVSVDNVGRSFPPQNPPRRVKFLIEWKEHTIPVVLDDTETLGKVAVNACMEIFHCL